MTKARTSGQKRRDKRNRAAKPITLPGGEAAMPRRPQGYREPKRPADEVALHARIRQTGLTPEQARDEMAGCAVGRKLLMETLTDRPDLWQAVKHMRRVWLAYDRAIGAPNRHAQCLRILTPADRMQADASSPAHDLRPKEDRDRAAVTAWMALQGWLDHCDRSARTACIRHVVDEPEQPIADWPGIILALRCVVDGIKGRQVQWRGRYGA